MFVYRFSKKGWAEALTLNARKYFQTVCSRYTCSNEVLFQFENSICVRNIDMHVNAFSKIRITIQTVKNKIKVAVAAMSKLNK